MFSGCLQDFPGCFQDAPMGLVGLVEFADHFKWKYGLSWSKGIRSSPTIWWSHLFDDRQLFDDQLEVWTLIIQKSTVMPPSLMILLAFHMAWKDYICQVPIWYSRYPLTMMEAVWQFLWWSRSKPTSNNCELQLLKYCKNTSLNERLKTRAWFCCVPGPGPGRRRSLCAGAAV